MPVQSHILGSVFMMWSHETHSCHRGLHSCGQTQCEIRPKAASSTFVCVFKRECYEKKYHHCSAAVCGLALQVLYQPIFSLKVHDMSLKLKWNIRLGDDGIMVTYSHTGSVNLNEVLIGMEA